MCFLVFKEEKKGGGSFSKSRVEQENILSYGESASVSLNKLASSPHRRKGCRSLHVMWIVN